MNKQKRTFTPSIAYLLCGRPWPDSYLNFGFRCIVGHLIPPIDDSGKQHKDDPAERDVMERGIRASEQMDDDSEDS